DQQRTHGVHAEHAGTWRGFTSRKRRHIIDVKLEKLRAQVAGQRGEPLGVSAILRQLQAQFPVHRSPLATPTDRMHPWVCLGNDITYGLSGLTSSDAYVIRRRGDGGSVASGHPVITLRQADTEYTKTANAFGPSGRRAGIAQTKADRPVMAR